jgi:hypothetical protein
MSAACILTIFGIAIVGSLAALFVVASWWAIGHMVCDIIKELRNR